MSRTTWPDLPVEARRAVEANTGRVTRAESASSGVMSAFASVLQGAGSDRVFVKGAPADAADAWVYRHEARVTRVAPLAPAGLWEVEAGGWMLFGYEFIAGRPIDFSPASLDLPSLTRTLTQLSQDAWPADIGKKPLSDRLNPFVPSGSEGIMDGRGLAHTDLGAFNLLITARGVRALDWALSCPAPAWADTAFTVPRLIAAGHSPAEADALALSVPAYKHLAAEELTAISRTIHDFWAHRTSMAPLPQRVKLTGAARSWMEFQAHCRG